SSVGRFGVVIGIAFLVTLSPSRAEAWNPLKAAADKLKAAGRAIGGGLGAPVGGFIESATTPSVHNFEDAGHRLLADVDSAIATNLGRAGTLVTQVKASVDSTLTQVDRSLQARILQVQTGIDNTIDHSFDRIELVIGRLEGDLDRALDSAKRIG